jgi:hypothetical protein
MKISIAVFLSLILASFNCYAIKCNEQSQAYKSLGEKYYELEDPKPLTSEQANAIRTVFENIAGRELVGSGRFIECIGPGATAKKQTSREKLSGKLSLFSDSSFSLALEIYTPKTKVRSLNTSHYPNQNQAYTITHPGKNTLVINSRMRRKKTFIEDNVEFNVSGRQLNVVITRYIHGHFAFQIERKLTV